MTERVFHVGFTGTRKGMTDVQMSRFREYLVEYRRKMNPEVEVVLHHGDCKGADYQAHMLAYETDWAVEIHPGLDKNDESPHRAHCYDERPDNVREVYDPAPYGSRNMDIIMSSAMLLATPKTKEQTPRSGTWGTINAALRMGRPVIYFYPDGSVDAEGMHDEDDHE